ncbi:hypothetical protein [Fodinibius sp. Rm-B-1B1-1]|uniref:hypothetical protein n=1 Tax=Fodinibius alkaliphilus TaxID=3140241 RepID=UPI00315A5CDF
MNWKVVRIIGLAFVLITAIISHGIAQQSNIKLSVDPANGAADSMKIYISKIKQGINHPKSWKGITLPGNHPAIGLLNNVMDTKGITAMRTAEPLHVLSHPDGTYEIRDIYVKTAQTDTLEHRALSLQFNSDAQLIGVKLVDHLHNYQLALDRKIEASSRKRAEVVKTLQTFQNALTNEDPQKVSSSLASNAHIVKGDIVRYFYQDTMGPYFRYTAISADEFAASINDSENSQKVITYDDISVYQFPQLQDVFVTTFHQKWQDRAYSDEGYVAMVIDLRDGVEVPVRVWQDGEFETGHLESQLSPITKMTVPLLNSNLYNQTGISFDLPNSTSKTKHKGFLATNKRWLLLGAGASAAISVGTLLLTGSGESELPNPPGRPAMQ